MSKKLIYCVLAYFVFIVAHADPVPLDCSGSDCGPVTIPGNMPPAGQAQPVGTAPGYPIEAPSGQRDPVAPNAPPPPSVPYSASDDD